MAKKAGNEIKVLRASTWSKSKKADPVTFFDVEVNGVTIYGCTLVEGKKGSFTSFPSYKGSNGSYYKHAYVELSDDDQEEIEQQIQELLEKDS